MFSDKYDSDFEDLEGSFGKEDGSFGGGNNNFFGGRENTFGKGNNNNLFSRNNNLFGGNSNNKFGSNNVTFFGGKGNSMNNNTFSSNTFGGNGSFGKSDGSFGKGPINENSSNLFSSSSNFSNNFSSNTFGSFSNNSENNSISSKFGGIKVDNNLSNSTLNSFSKDFIKSDKECMECTKKGCDIKIDRKSELTLDFMMIVGKYFESNNDFINVMKTNTIYNELAEMYHFNPISDPSLFENMETQHFYNSWDFDEMIPEMYQYVNWTHNYMSQPNNVINKRPELHDEIFNQYANDFIKNGILYIPGYFSKVTSLDGTNFNNITKIYFDDNVKITSSVFDAIDTNRYLLSNFQNVTEIKFPLSGVDFNDDCITNCPNLSRIYLPPNIYSYEYLISSSNLDEIVLSKTFTKQEFYSFLGSINYLIWRGIFLRGRFNVQMPQDKVIKVIVRNVPLVKDELITEMAKNSKISNPIFFESDKVAALINGINTVFIFTDKIENGYLDY